MKKLIKLFSFLLVALCVLTGCGGKYKKEAGLYELTSMSVNGQDYMYVYDYYTIELEADGDYECKFKLVSDSTSYEVEGTFDIDSENSKINFYSKSNNQIITETYGYVEGVIVMEVTLYSQSCVATFERLEK